MQTHKLKERQLPFHHDSLAIKYMGSTEQTLRVSLKTCWSLFMKTVGLNCFPTDPGYNWLNVPFSAGGFRSPTSKTTHRKDSSKACTSTDVFSCPREGCVRVFQRLSSLERHLSLEKCTRALERQSLFDLAKTQYATHLQEGVGAIPTLKSQGSIVPKEAIPNVHEGWALKETKKAYRFNDAQRAYLEAKFNIGKSTGRKVDAEAVAKEMRRSVGSDGKRLFNVSEFLTPQQVTSFFSRLAAKSREKINPRDEDLRAHEEEMNYAAARCDILSKLHLEHPIVYDQYNICTMAKNGTLKTLKLGLLQLLCESFELETPAVKLRKKTPYLTLLENLVSSCSCSRPSVK